MREMLTRQERRVRLFLIAMMASTALLLTVGEEWTGEHRLVALLAFNGFVILDWEWLKRAVVRRARALEQHALALGLTPSVADPRLYEGSTQHGAVRVWVVDDPRETSTNRLTTFLGTLVLGAGFWLGAGFGPIGLALAVAVACLWTAWTTRPSIEIEGVCEDGLRHHTRVRRFRDVEAAIAALPTVPPAPPEEFAPSPNPIWVRPLLSRVASARDEDTVVKALVALGEAGRPGSLAALTGALKARKGPLSTRIALAADRTAARIRERHGLPEPGALGLSDANDAGGRVGLASDTGALSPSEREE